MSELPNKYLAFDSETHLIGGNERAVCQCGEVHGQAPPVVCWQFATSEGRSEVVDKYEGLARVWDGLQDEELHFVGHETAYDVLVAVENAPLIDVEPEDMLERWIAAYDAGRVHDTAIRQKLLDLARGRYRWHRHPNGSATRINYDLGTTSRRNGGPDIDKGDEWRTKYATLDGVPLNRWPADALGYAEKDAIATIWAFENQADWRVNTNIEQLWSGYTALSHGLPHPFGDEIDQTCHALWLKDMSNHGIMTDAAAIEKFRGRAQLEFERLSAECIANGLVRREYWRNLQQLRELGHELRGNALWKDLKYWLDQEDPAAWDYWQQLEERGLVRFKLVRNEADAKARMLDVCVANNLEIPRTKGWDECFDKYGRAPEFHEYVGIDAESCRLSEDEALIDLAAYTHQLKILTADVPQLLLGVEHPIHSHFEPLLETGRISSAGPNITNRARGEKDRAGDRECFIPRPHDAQGRELVMLDADYPQLELFAHAQFCKWALGYSTLGDALLKGLDPHTDLGATIANISYAEAEILAEAKNLPERDAAKGYNFGRPGGLGTRKMVKYAAKSYKVVRTKEQWDDIFAQGDRKWREMRDFFAYVESLGDGEVFNLPQAWSGRLRAKCNYTQACNSTYQGLGADVAKRAGWYLFKACRVRGVDPDLYGCRIINFIHDQFLLECLRKMAARAAKRVEYWMTRAAVEVLPDYGWKMGEKLECIAVERWSKMSKKVTDAHGNLAVWRDERLVTP